VLMEQWMNRNTFTRKDIQTMDNIPQFDIVSPLGVDFKVPVRAAHALRTVVGRPLTMAESVGDVVTGKINPKTGEPYGWLERPGVMSWITGVKVSRIDERAVLIDEVAEMERNIREMKSSASRWGRKGYVKEEAQLLEQAHEIEEKLATGKWAPAKRELRNQQQERRRETKQRRSGMGAP